MRETAWFVKHPRRLEDLKLPHVLSAEQPYKIVGQVELDWIDYENFVTDLLVDREFLETWQLVAGEGTPMRCVLVTCQVRPDRLLVVPEDGCYVGYAAVI